MQLMLAMIADGFRWFVMAEACILVGFTFAILAEARKFRAPPRHVLGVAISYVIIVVAYGWEIGVHLGDPFTYRVVVGMIAFGFGLWSMFEMYAHYSYVERVRRHSTKGELAAKKMLASEMQEMKDVDRQRDKERTS